MELDTLILDYRPIHPLRNGLKVYVRHDQCGPDAVAPDHVVVAGECTVTGDFFILENVPLRGLSDWWSEGRAIQDALPGLTPAEREFIKSGIRPGALAPRLETIRFAVYGPEKGYFLRGDDPRSERYRLGYSGTIEVSPTDVNWILSLIFTDGNGEGDGPGFTVNGRSMSAGDVVHLDGYGCWLCASDGWTAIEAERFPLPESNLPSERIPRHTKRPHRRHAIPACRRRSHLPNKGE